MIEQSFFMVKPDGVARGLIGAVVSRIEEKGYKIKAMKMIKVDAALAEKHYAEHRGKPFYSGLVSFITSGPCVAMVVEGEEAVKGLRDLIGNTNPKNAAKGTIRGDFGTDVGQNVVHASDSMASAKREIALFFTKNEIVP